MTINKQMTNNKKREARKRKTTRDHWVPAGHGFGM